MPSPVKVLYILGSARSGSTFLGGVLGQADGVTSHGEISWLWDRGLLGRQLCGCGQPVQTCPFWSSVFSEWPDPQAQAKRMVHLAARVQRRRHVPYLLDGLRSARHRQYLDEYAAQLGKLYRGIQARSEARIVVDASKHPYYAMALQHASEVELYYLHLVRDSRATAYSWTRRKVLPDVPPPGNEMPRWNARKSAWNWLTDHVASLAAGGRGRSYVRVRYEDLAAAPEAVLSDAIARLDLAIDVDGVFARARDQKVLHTAGGNPSRFTPNWLVPKVDQEWRQGARRRDLALTTAMTWPLLLAFGYPLRPAAAPERPARAGSAPT